jgi:hypothetical protein
MVVATDLDRLYTRLRGRKARPWRHHAEPVRSPDAGLCVQRPRRVSRAEMVGLAQG